MDNAYIYTRVSTLIQVDGFSLDAQEEEIRAFAKQRNINIVGKYSDEGKSGKHADGHLIKTIHFTFPVTYDGESGVLFVSSTDGEVETALLLTRQS